MLINKSTSVPDFAETNKFKTYEGQIDRWMDTVNYMLLNINSFFPDDVSA